MRDDRRRGIPVRCGIRASAATTACGAWIGLTIELTGLALVGLWRIQGEVWLQKGLNIDGEASSAPLQEEAAAAYRDRERWVRMSIRNTASSGFFSTDRTMQEYNQDIWKLTPLNGG